VTGRLAVTDLASGTTRFELAADRLDLDRYLPAPAPGGPVAGEAAGRPEAAGALVGGAAALPAEALRALDLDGSVQIGALTAGGARPRRVPGALASGSRGRHPDGRGPAVRRQRASDQHPGRQSGAACDDPRRRPAGRRSARPAGGHCALEPPVGIASIDADLRWRGLSEAELKGSLDGRARVAVRDGAVQGFDLEGLVRKALAAVQGGRPAEVAGGPPSPS